MLYFVRLALDRARGGVPDFIFFVFAQTVPLALFCGCASKSVLRCLLPFLLRLRAPEETVVAHREQPLLLSLCLKDTPIVINVFGLFPFCPSFLHSFFFSHRLARCYA